MATMISIATLAAFFASVIFLVGYSVLAPWWRHSVGWTVASLDGALAVALVPGALHELFGVRFAYAWFRWYYVISLLLVAAVTLWRLAMVWRVQRAALRPDGAPSAERD